MLRYTTLFSNYNTYLIILSVFLSKLHARRQIRMFPHIPLSPLIPCGTQKSDRIISNFKWQLCSFFKNLIANHYFPWVGHTSVPTSPSLPPVLCDCSFSCIEPGLGAGGGASFSNLLDVSHMLQLVSRSLGACDWVSEWASACERLCSCASLSVFRFLEIAALPVCGWRILEDRMKIHSCAFSGYQNTTFGVLSRDWQL